ncbi:MAG: serine/threonine protein kinase [Bryobacterales bacterium]|nr:serine/threonine protein kinase [Bryobacterales bacterium]
MTAGPPESAPAARWKRVREVFDGALDLSREELTRYLDAVCGTDGELREEVLSLIAALGEAGAFLEDPVVHLAAPRTSAGRQIGPYRLESLLGQGGMGEVYLSKREVDGYAMPVALKLIRHSAVTPGALRRFRMERQILARLHHAGITQLFDGGITDDGLPYLVTEYVDGNPLDKSEVARAMDLRRRLEAFQSICDAVSYAHRQLVVHGDLKPGNILMNPDGGIKLLDFGISRLLLTGEDTTESKTGGTTQLAMTPAWASPEQLRGEPVGVASDVYSLGRILYFLLTWELATPIEQMAPMQYYEKLQKEAPPRPSVRSGDRKLEGDLDNIALKAVEFEPSERYPSVEALAEDIRAHLASRPIAARSHTWTYRAHKFVRRNRLMVLAAGAVALALLAGLGMTLWQARIARLNYERGERRFQDLRRLATTFIFDMDDAVARLPGTTAVRATMIRNSLQYLDGLAQEGVADPSLQEDLADAYEKVGDVQGRPGSMNLGGTAASLQSYRKAEGIRRTLLSGAKENAERDRREEALANTLMRISSILRATGDGRQALEADQTALEMRRRLWDRKPEDMARQRNVASSLTATSASLSLVGAFQGVMELRREGLRLYGELAKRNPGREDDEQGLALAHTRMASILMHDKDMKGAVKHYREALRIQTALSIAHSGQAQYRISLGLAQSNLGNALRVAGDPKAALASFAIAVRQYEPLVIADANEVRARTLLATVRLREAKAWNDLGDTKRAARLLRAVLEERRFLAERNPANAGARGEVAEAHGVLGDVALRARQLPEAAAQYETALRLFAALETEGRSNAADHEEVARIRASLAGARVKKP